MQTKLGILQKHDSVSQPEDPIRANTVLTTLAKGHASLSGRNYITIEDIPIVVKTVLSTAQIERVGLLYLLIANKGKLTTPMIEKSLNVAKPTALRTMSELKAIGLVDKDEVLEGGNHVKRITLKTELDCFHSEEFEALLEGFKPVDNREFMNMKTEEKEEEMSDKEKLPPYAAALEKIDTFQRIFAELEAETAADPSIMASDDKNTVAGDKLRERLVSSGKFYQSDAAIIIEDMVKARHIEKCAFDTYRRK